MATKLTLAPVKHVYATIWDAYKEANSFYPLVYIMRQIVEYYFIHILNYKEEMLRERVQEAAEELTVEHEKGGLDLSQRNQLLAFWMSFEQDPLAQLDDHYISQGSISVDDLRVEFEELFRVLGQHEHFEMMSLC